MISLGSPLSKIHKERKMVHRFRAGGFCFERFLRCLALLSIFIGVCAALETFPGRVIAQVVDAPAASDSERVIVVGTETGYPPFCLVTPEGEADGFSVELIVAAAAAMDLEVEFEVGPWNEVRGWLEEGKVDVLPLVGRTPERELLYDFTIPYLTMHGAIVVPRGEEGIRKLGDLKGRKVAVMKGDNAEEFLRRGGFELEIELTTTFEEAFGRVVEGECDAVVCQRLMALRLLEETGLLDRLRIVDQPVFDFAQDFCFAVQEGDRSLLAVLNEGLAIVIADGTFRRLHAKWFAGMELPSNRPILLGGDQNYPPFEYLDEKGQPAGYNVDLARAVADAVGLEIDVRLGPWPIVLQKLELGELDGVMGMFFSLERDQRFDFSQAHIINHCVAVVQKGKGPPPRNVSELAGKRIVVQDGDIMHEFALQNIHGAEVIAVSTQEEALKALADGEFDCALASRMTVLYWIHELGLDGLEVGTAPLPVSEYCFAVPNGSKALLAELSEGLKAVEQSGEYWRIHNKWFGFEQSRVFPLWLILRYAAMILLPLLLILGGAILWSWSLRTQVRERTEEIRQREQQFRSLLESAPEAIFVQTDLRFAYVNPAALQLFGATEASQLLGGLVEARFHPEFRESVRERIRRLNEEKLPVPMAEETCLRLDGGEVTTEVVAVPTRYEGKDGALVFARDISERVKNQAALRRIEWMLSPVEASEGAVGSRGNPQIYGDLVETNRSRVILDAVGRDALEDIVQDYLGLLETSAVVYERNGDYAMGIFASGWCQFLDCSSRALCETDDNLEAMASGRWLCHESCWRDAALKSMETGGPADSECAGGIRIYGVPVRADGEIVGAMTFGYGDPPRERRQLVAISEKYRVGIEPLIREARSYESRPPYIVKLAKRRLELSARLVGEIVERRHAQARVEHLNRVLRSIRSVNQLIVRESQDAHLIENAARILVDQRSYESVLILLTTQGGDLDSFTMAGDESVFRGVLPHVQQGLLPPCMPECFRAECASPAEGPKEDRGGGGGEQAPLGDSGLMGAPLVHAGRTFGYLFAVNRPGMRADEEERELFGEIAADLAFGLSGFEMHRAKESAEKDRDQAQHQLAAAQRLESVGRLAGGVAHDFNNLLMGIMNYVELCRENIDRDHPITEWLNEISVEADRSAQLVRQLLAFARKQTIAPVVLDLNDAIPNMWNMIGRLIGEDIRLLWEPGHDLWPVKLDPAQVDQILVNLCMNARDSIAKVGTITVETKNTQVDFEYCRTHPEALPGDYVMLAVSDNGRGMDRTTLEHIFEPFFTTKGRGQGTGLGLATVYGIIKQNRGFINVYSEVGVGSTFRIFLPASLAESTPRPMVREGGPVVGGSETILLVEDEKAIRFTVRIFLERLGYQVLSASSPEDALTQLKEYKGGLDLLVTDVVMPGMSGRDLAEQLKGRYPGMQCLFMSGYTANVIAQHGILESDVHFLPKPFKQEHLAGEVRRLLDLPKLG